VCIRTATGPIVASTSQVVFPPSTIISNLVSTSSTSSSIVVSVPSISSSSIPLVSIPYCVMADVVVRFSLTIYAPLDLAQIPGQPHALTTGEYGERLPKLAGNNAITFEDHVNTFLKFIDDLEVEHEDVVMKMFVQTIEGDAREWYKPLPTNSTDEWDSFKRQFKLY
jgi:hypothetical protein